MFGSGQSRSRRLLLAPIALLTGLIGAIVVPPTAAQATSSSENYHTIGETSNPGWMGWVPDATSLAAISIPGTHETLSIHEGPIIDLTQTQEGYGDNGATLAKQLDAGIRAIDVRGRREGDRYAIYHGPTYQQATLDDVLRVLGEFLSVHPTETVLMRFKAECAGGITSCTDEPSDTSAEDRAEVFKRYADASPYFYRPTVTGTGGAAMPTLGAVRGKIVLTQFQGVRGGTYGGYGLKQLNDDNATYIQDDYDVPTIFDIDDKWNKVRAHLDRTNADSADRMYINYTSGSSAAAYPYTVAGGTGSDTVRGVNWFAMGHLFGGFSGRTGVLMMDFPGAALIDVIISHNYRIAPWNDGVRASAEHTFTNVARRTGGNAEERSAQIRTFLAHVTPEVRWQTAVVKRDYAFSVDPGRAFLDAGEQGGYRVLAWDTELTSSAVSREELAPVLDAAVAGLTGDDHEQQATQLREELGRRFPNQWWSVIVRIGDGGFQNWITQTYGVTYSKSVDNRAYLAIGVDRTEDTQPDPGAPGTRIAYFPSWSIYANGYFPKTIDTNGTAARLTHLQYAFENIDPVNLTCMAANKPGTSDDNDPDGNDGAGDAWADYQRGFPAEESVDGVGDQWAQPLKGNFNQLKKLKAKHPHLKVLVSIGGWTYSKWFSDAAATPASRQKFVRSCVDMYIRGNLPKLGDDPAGGTGAAAGVFDGIDIDWEFPAVEGRPGNHYGPQDTANFTALMAEFRRQLDAVGGKRYELTAAVPAGPAAIGKIQAAQVAQYLDLANVMSYDMHGAWETAGPTNFNAPLYDPTGNRMSADDAIRAYIANGFPANKLTMGVPFYARGWTGVPNGGTDGLYQPVTGPTAPFPYSQSPGVAMYKELAAAGKLDNVHFDPATKGAWAYDGTNFWSVETPRTLQVKRRYIRASGLAGVMIYSLESDDANATLLKAATGMS